MELILGVAVSLATELLKRIFGTSRLATIGIAFLLAIIGAIIYNTIVAFGGWDTFVRVLTAAGAFYAFIIKSFEPVSK